MAAAKFIYKGGSGSGNFGHGGRPGKVGGSADGGSGSAPAKLDISDSKQRQQVVYAAADISNVIRDNMMVPNSISEKGRSFVMEATANTAEVDNFEKHVLSVFRTHQAKVDVRKGQGVVRYIVSWPMSNTAILHADLNV